MVIELEVFLLGHLFGYSCSAACPRPHKEQIGLLNPLQGDRLTYYFCVGKEENKSLKSRELVSKSMRIVGLHVEMVVPSPSQFTTPKRAKVCPSLSWWRLVIC